MFWTEDPTQSPPELEVHQNGGAYAIVASQCYLNSAANQTFHLSVWGWDGTNELTVIAAPIPMISEPLCLADARAPASAPVPSPPARP